MNELIINRFKRLMQANRLAHAYFFVGPQGSGKLQAALEIAKMVNGLNTETHPDIHLYGNTDEDTIKIEEVRQMLSRAALKAYEARIKVFIFKDAHRMTNEAANALLKTLEEPTPNTLFILTTSMPQQCLDTIKSRCHSVLFFTKEDQLPNNREEVLNVFLSKASNDEYFKKLAASQAKVKEAMLVLYSFFKEALLFKAGVDYGALTYQHRLNDLRVMANRTVDDLGAICQQIVRTQSLNEDNLNVKMSLSLVRQRIWDN